MFTYKAASMIPVKMQIEVASSMLILAHTCTLTGCFGRSSGLGLSLSFCNNVNGVFQFEWKLHLNISRFQNNHSDVVVPIQVVFAC